MYWVEILYIVNEQILFSPISSNVLTLPVAWFAHAIQRDHVLINNRLQLPHYTIYAGRHHDQSELYFTIMTRYISMGILLLFKSHFVKHVKHTPLCIYAALITRLWLYDNSIRFLSEIEKLIYHEVCSIMFTLVLAIWCYSLEVGAQIISICWIQKYNAACSLLRMFCHVILKFQQYKKG